jgi:hypothetical protein
MKKLVASAVLLLSLGGCAQMLSISTPDQIRQSEFRAQIASSKPAVVVANCMKETLLAYRSDSGRASYALITFRDFEKQHEIMLRNDVGTSLYSGLTPEILFLVENTSSARNGTDSMIWVHQRLLNDGGSKGYLNRLMAVLKPCVGEVDGTQPAGMTRARETGGGTDEAMRKLEQLKGLADRGVISKDDFEKKKREILDAM